MSKKYTFKELFKNDKPIFGMLHLKGESNEEILKRAIDEIKIYVDNGVDAVVVENYFGKPHHVEIVLQHLKEHTTDITYGVNLLDNDVLGFEMAKKYDAKFIQLDSVAGHLIVEEDVEFNEFMQKNRQECKALVFGGVRFKYQPYNSGRSLEEDLKIGMTRCDAIVVTGDATGMETNSDKIKSFRSIIGEFPLIIGAGITPSNCKEQLELANGAIVGSYFKDTYKDTGDVDENHVKEMISAVNKVR